jgi:integral membrane protein (TIGR01906 family)
VDGTQDRTGTTGQDPLDKSDPPADNDAVAVAGRQRETHMGFIRSLATIVFVVALPIAILTTNIRLLLNAPLIYGYSFDRYNAEESTGLSRDDLDACAAELRRYFNNSEPTYYCTVTENGLPAPIFTSRETQHMEDVKDLVVWVNRLQIASLMFVVAYGVVFFVWSREGNLGQLAGQCLASLLVGGLAIGALAAIAAVGFDAAFERFHEIAFSNDLWRLNPRTDHLIQMFPEEFWRDATFILGGLCLIEAALIAAVSGIYLLSSRGGRSRIHGVIDVGTSSTQAA